VSIRLASLRNRKDVAPLKPMTDVNYDAFAALAHMPADAVMRINEELTRVSSSPAAFFRR
jgi:hypothetical protein